VDVLAGGVATELLAEDENEYRGRAIARTQVAAVDDFGERGLLVGPPATQASTSSGLRGLAIRTRRRAAG
jgi:hypothetical protein